MPTKPQTQEVGDWWATGGQLVGNWWATDTSNPQPKKQAHAQTTPAKYAK
jgi:hypothetical protein